MYTSKILMFALLAFSAVVLADIAFFFGVHFLTNPLEGFSSLMKVIIYLFMGCNLVLLSWFFYIFPANKVLVMEKPTLVLVMICLSLNIVHITTSLLEVFDGYFEGMVDMNYKMFGLIILYFLARSPVGCAPRTNG